MEREGMASLVIGGENVGYSRKARPGEGKIGMKGELQEPNKSFKKGPIL